MASIAPFPKIPSYRGEADPLHVVRRVVALEKIDGTNTRIGLGRAEVEAGHIEPTVGGRTLLETDQRFSQVFLGPMVRRNAPLCRGLVQLVRAHDADVVLYGETCGGSIQRMGFIYGAKPHFVLFAATIGGVWLSWSRASLGAVPSGRALPTVQQIAAQCQVPTPPVLFEGEAHSTQLHELLDRPSAYSISQGFDRHDVDRSQEGIVVWADPLLLTLDRHPIAAKLKHPRRREIATIDATDSLEVFAERVMLPERLRHAREHLVAAGKWPTDRVTQIQKMVRRSIQDVAKEVVAYEERLTRHGKKSTRAALERAARVVAEAILQEE